MARKPVVTRTFESTRTRLLYVNLADNSTYVSEITLLGTFKSHDKLLKQATALSSEGTKPVHVLSTEVVKELRKMPLQKFYDESEPCTAEDAEAEEDNQ